MPKFAAIICTRNRPDALHNTLSSVAEQDLSPKPFPIVVDGSDDAIYQENRKRIANLSLSTHHYRYAGTPSAARQRNVGLHLLPDSIERVFFFDDDITLRDNCLCRLKAALNTSAALSGVGASEIDETGPSPDSSSRLTFWKHLFLLDHPQPGRVLPSGHVSLYNSLATSDTHIPTQWLSTCCCLYERDILEKVRFDESLRGALLEDRDFSYRISQHADLAVVPRAQFVHHRSPINRRSSSQLAHDRTVQRYWFVEKNVSHFLGKPAYWWSTLGQILAVLTSSKEERDQVLRGRLKGIYTVLRRSHSLLH